MSIYLIVFVLSCFLLWTVEKKNTKSFLYKLIVFFALLLPILLAGLRRIGVGTDTTGYVQLLYNAAKQTDNIKDYFTSSVWAVYRYIKVSNWELGYSTMIYIVTKLFGSYQAVLFVTHIVITVPIYKGLFYFKEKISVWFGMLIFYFLYYCPSLNLMRQWIAMALLFWGFTLLVENKVVKYFVVVLVATLFHSSGVIGIIIFAIYKYTVSQTRQKIKVKYNGADLDMDIYKVLMILLAGIIVLIGLNFVGKLLSMLGMTRYVTVYLSGGLSFMPNQIIRRLPTVILLVLNWKNLCNLSKLTPFYATMVVMDLLISQLNSLYSQSGRISYFFSEFYMLLYPVIVNSVKSTINRRIVKVVIILYIIAFWYYDYVYNGWGETVPYMFYFE